MGEEKLKTVTLTTFARSNALKRSREMRQYGSDIESREGFVSF